MIESITIQGVATYSTSAAQAMTRLSKLNFVYWCNGACKTTVSRVVERDVLPEGCEVRWSASGPLQKFVYNRDFVQRSLAQSSQIKGIFLNDAGMIRPAHPAHAQRLLSQRSNLPSTPGREAQVLDHQEKQGTSFIESKDNNPLSSSYELLWQELHEENLSPTTLQKYDAPHP